MSKLQCLLAFGAILPIASLLAAPSASAQSGADYQSWLRWCQQQGGVDVGGPNRPNCSVNRQNSNEPPPLDPRLYWIGVSATVEGDVTFIYPTGQRVAGNNAIRTPIALGTKVVTGPGGRARFLLLDETGFTVGPNSELVLDRFVYDPATAQVEKTALKILRGEFRFRTGNVRKRKADAISIGTPVGTIGGFRGTEIVVDFDPGGSGYIETIEGEVDFIEFDTGKITVLPAGRRLIVENFAVVGIR